MATDTRDEIEAEFTPAGCWDMGWSVGFDGSNLFRFFETCERELERPLTANEKNQMRRGYLAGLRNRTEWHADQQAMSATESVTSDAIPF